MHVVQEWDLGCKGVVHFSLKGECELHNSTICGLTSLSIAKKSFYSPSAVTQHYAYNKRKVAILQFLELLSLILRATIMLFYFLQPLKHLFQSFCKHLRTSLSIAFEKFWLYLIFISRTFYYFYSL